MKLLKQINILNLFTLAILSVHSVFAVENIFSPGLYQIEGSHSLLGHYRGFLLIKNNYEVQRIIKFVSLNQDHKRKIGFRADQNFIVEQLWQGYNSSEGIQFQIRASNVLTAFNEYSPVSNDFSFENILLSKNKESFQLKNDGVYTEVFTFFSKDETNLFIKDSRVKLDSNGETGSFLVNIAGRAGVNKAIKEYRNLPHLIPYREREEFINNQVFQIKDLTDLEFYRSNISTLRVRNKSITPLSIGEALQRREAFLPTLAEKAEFKQRETRRLMNGLGIFEEGTIDSNGQIISLRPQGDTALWFGIYIWSLYLEDQQIQSADTYQRLKSAIESLNHLIEISPDPKLFARYIHKSQAGEFWPDPNIRQGIGKYSDYKYDSRSNNDMVKGFFLGYLIAYKSLKVEDKELRSKIAVLVQRIQQLDPIQKKTGNKAISKGLDALWNKNLVSLKEFIDGSDGLINILSDEFHIDSGFHIGGMTNPSGIHLNLISQSIRYLLADALIQKVKKEGERMYLPIPRSETSPGEYENPTPRLAAIKKSAGKNIKNLSLRMNKAYFNYLNIAAYAITRDEGLKNAARGSVWGLIEVPKVRSVGLMYGELSLQPDWMYSSWPFEPWTALKGPWVVDKEKLNKKNQRRGGVGYPIFECAGLSSTYLWVDGTNDFPCRGNSSHIAFSADYLWIYWLARSSKVITELE